MAYKLDKHQTRTLNSKAKKIIIEYEDGTTETFNQGVVMGVRKGPSTKEADILTTESVCVNVNISEMDICSKGIADTVLRAKKQAIEFLKNDRDMLKGFKEYLQNN